MPTNHEANELPPLYLLPTAYCLLLALSAAAQDAKDAAPPTKEAPVSEAIKEGADKKPDAKLDAKAAARKRPLNLIDLPAGYTLLRNEKNLAPRTYLYVNFAALDVERFVFPNPTNPKNYVIVRLNDGNNNLEKATGSAATALGMSSPTKKKSADAKFLDVTDANIANKTVRLYIPRAQRGDQLEVTMENVREIVYLDDEGEEITGDKPKDEKPKDEKSAEGDKKDGETKEGDKPKDGAKPDDKPAVEVKKEDVPKVAAALAADAAKQPPPSEKNDKTDKPGDPPANPTAAAPEGTVRTVTRPIRLRLKNPVTVESGTSLSLRPDVNIIANQKLTDGNTKAVVQIPLRLEIPSLRQTDRTNTYLRSDTTLSTNVRDVAARINLTYGIEGNVRGTRWQRLPLIRNAPGVIPAYSEIRLDASEDFKSIAFTLDNGIKRRLGRAATDPLWDSQLRSETNPVLGFNAFWEQRLSVNRNSSPRHAATFSPGLSASLNFPSFELFSLPGAARKVQLVADAKAWFLPFEKGANGQSPAYTEYAYSIGLRAPMPKALGGDRALSLTLVSGANPASGYLRSNSVQIKLEGIQF